MTPMPPAPGAVHSAERRAPEVGSHGLDGGGAPPRSQARRTVAIAALGVVALVVAVVLVVANPFGGSHPAGGSASGNAAATSLATVARRSLAAQQSENGTLSYAGSFTVINQAGAGGGGEGAGGKGHGGGGRGDTITSLPALGAVIQEGQILYEVQGEPVALLYGQVPAYRTLSNGMSGKDVEELNGDLVALGYAGGAAIGEHPEYFGAETEAALRALQERLGVVEANGVKRGRLALGQAVFLPEALRITKVTGTLGGTAQQGGPLMEASSTRRQVVVKLDASEQASVRTGDNVTITLPDNRTTPGVVSSVGRVAQSASSGARGGEEEGTPTIEVQITPTDPRATGTLDRAPVHVAITTASVQNALVVPVSALLALAEGGYAVEVAEGSSHHLVGVTLGLFDNADGLVQVSGQGLQAGQRVVVPST
ncbi:MAG: peptidoglycan-binding protein [Acidobacteriota bacterium]|nr:peptidoglycan-binding protein [Acidobacteriota bacterium]